MKTGRIAEKDLKVGGVYRNRRGEELILLGRGAEGGKKYLFQKVYSGGKTYQETVDEDLSVLERPCVIPYWRYSGSFSVVEQVGTTKVPDGLPAAFEKRIAAVQASATAWNRATSR